MALSPADRAALHDLYARYAYTFDDADADGWSDCHDGEWRLAVRDIVTELDAGLVDAPFAFELSGVGAA